MKTNVDLTASRTFSTQRREISLTKVMREFGKHFLWDYEHMKMVQSDYDLSNYKNSLILCGNASERQMQRFNHALDTGDICECCVQIAASAAVHVQAYVQQALLKKNN